MIYYIKRRKKGTKEWKFAFNADITGFVKFKDKKEAKKHADDLNEQEKQLSDELQSEYKAFLSEHPRNITSKHKLYVPQYWDERYEEWRDCEIDGGEGLIYFNVEDAKMWIRDNIDNSYPGEPIIMRLKVFSFVGPTYFYKRKG